MSNLIIILILILFYIIIFVLINTYLNRIMIKNKIVNKKNNNLNLKFNYTVKEIENIKNDIIKTQKDWLNKVKANKQMNSKDFLYSYLYLLDKYNSINESKNIAHKFFISANQQLDIFPNSLAKQHLQHILQYASLRIS